MRSIRAFFLFLFTTTALFGGSSSELEAKVKAAYLYNFIKFVEWPSRPAKIRVCVVGDEMVSSMLSNLAAKGANLELVASVSECQLLYLSIGELKAKEQLQKVQKAGVLTVGDSENFIRHGGMVELYEEGGKIKFAVSLPMATKANLRISSKLLELARVER